MQDFSYHRLTPNNAAQPTQPPLPVILGGKQLPPEIVDYIFTFVPKNEWPQQRRVCRAWKQLLSGARSNRILRLEFTRFAVQINKSLEGNLYPDQKAAIVQLLDRLPDPQNLQGFSKSLEQCRKSLQNILADLPQEKLTSLEASALTETDTEIVRIAKRLFKVDCWIRQEVAYSIHTSSYLQEYNAKTGSNLTDGGLFVPVTMIAENGWNTDPANPPSPRKCTKLENADVPSYIFLDHLEGLKNGNTFDLRLSDGRILRAKCISNPTTNMSFEECVEHKNQALFKSFATSGDDFARSMLALKPSKAPS